MKQQINVQDIKDNLTLLDIQLEEIEYLSIPESKKLQYKYKILQWISKTESLLNKVA